MKIQYNRIEKYLGSLLRVSKKLYVGNLCYWLFWSRFGTCTEDSLL